MTIRLEPLGESHLEAVGGLLDDPDVQRFTRVPVPAPADFPRRWLLTDWAFEELGALRIELLIDVDNEPSKRVAERCGYVREGVLRSTYLKQDLRSDTEIWSRLPTDPPPR